MTVLQKKSSRTNGASSHGPITEEGKRRSSQNALKHGFSAGGLTVLDGENLGGYDELVKTYKQQIGRLDNVGIVSNLVEDLAAARWRLYRTWVAEKTKLDQAIAAQPHELGAALCFANGWLQLANDHGYTLLQRYETELGRKFNRTLGRLFQFKDPRDLLEIVKPEMDEEEVETGDKAA